MQLFDVRPEFFVKQIRCDRCGRLTESEDGEFRESVSVALKAGDASVFGDTRCVEVDLCQHCLKRTLGPWLRFSRVDAKQVCMLKKPSRLDSAPLADVFPNAVDQSLPVPDAPLVQNRAAPQTMLDIKTWPASLGRFIGYSVQLFFAPLTGAIRGIRQEYRRLDRAERARRKRYTDIIRHG